MKNKIILAIMSLSFLAFPAYSKNTACPNGVIKVGWESYNPFCINGKNENDAPTGIDIDFMTAIVKEAGCKIEFVHDPWKRQLANLEKGLIDIAMNAGKIPEREVYAIYLSSYIRGGNAIFVKKKSLDKYKDKIKKLEDMADIPGFRLGVTNGVDYGEVFNKALTNPKFKSIIDQSRGDDFNILKAEKNRVNAFIGDVVVIPDFLTKMEKEEMFEIFPVVADNSGDAYYIYSKKSVPMDVAQQLDSIQKKFMKDGTFYKIMSKYITPAQIKSIQLN